MEKPKIVESWLRGSVIFSAVVSVAASLWLWSIKPFASWVLLILGLAVLFACISALYAITIWPLMLLLGKLFSRGHTHKVEKKGLNRSDFSESPGIP